MKRWEKLADESMNKCPSYAERVKYLNEEVGGGLSEGA